MRQLTRQLTEIGKAGMPAGDLPEEDDRPLACRRRCFQPCSNRRSLCIGRNSKATQSADQIRAGLDIAGYRMQILVAQPD